MLWHRKSYFYHRTTTITATATATQKNVMHDEFICFGLVWFCVYVIFFNSENTKKNQLIYCHLYLFDWLWVGLIIVYTKQSYKKKTINYHSTCCHTQTKYTATKLWSPGARWRTLLFVRSNDNGVELHSVGDFAQWFNQNVCVLI